MIRPTVRAGVVFVGVLLFLPPFLVVPGAPAAKDEGWTVDRVVQLLRLREQSVESLEAYVDRVEGAGSGLKDYSVAQITHDEAHAKLNGYLPQIQGRLARLRARIGKEPHFPPPQSYRLRKNARGDLNIEVRSGPKSDAKAQLLASYCYNGTVWEHNMPLLSSGPRVVLDNSVELPLVLQALGLGSPFQAATDSMTPLPTGRAESFADCLAAAAAAGQVDKPGPAREGEPAHSLRVAFRRKVGNLARAKHGYHMQLTVWLDPRRGLVPLKVDAVEVTEKDGQFRPPVEPGGYQATWGDFAEVVPGTWLARSMTLVTSASVLLPKGGTEFKEQMEDGKPAKKLPGGEKRIDLAQTVVKRFELSATKMTVTDVQVNRLGEGRLCGAEYAAGTIVEDRIKRETFQLEGVSPAIDAKVKKVLSAQAEKLEEERPAARTGWWLKALAIAGANVAVVLAVVLGYRRFRRRHAVSA
jgi:hypothetical protein